MASTRIVDDLRAKFGKSTSVNFLVLVALFRDFLPQVVLAIFVISVTLGAQNDQQVTFNYLLAQGEYRISTLLAVLFAAGFAIGWLICGLFWLRVRVSLARAERKIKRLENQLSPATDVAVVPHSSAAKE